MCVLLTLDYPKFGVSNLFFQKLSRKIFGGRLDPSPPLVKAHMSGVVSNLLIHMRSRLSLKGYSM